MMVSKLTIENNHNVPVRVFDGTFFLGSYLSGEQKTVALRGIGTRRITARWFGGDATTAEYNFESNPAWLLIINLGGKLDLNLQASRRP